MADHTVPVYLQESIDCSNTLDSLTEPNTTHQPADETHTQLRKQNKGRRVHRSLRSFVEFLFLFAIHDVCMCVTTLYPTNYLLLLLLLSGHNYWWLYVCTMYMCHSTLRTLWPCASTPVQGELRSERVASALLWCGWLPFSKMFSVKNVSTTSPLAQPLSGSFVFTK